MHTCIYTYIYMYVDMYTYIYVCVHATYIHTYIHTNIHIHTYTHIYIYIYIYIYMSHCITGAVPWHNNHHGILACAKAHIAFILAGVKAHIAHKTSPRSAKMSECTRACTHDSTLQCTQHILTCKFAKSHDCTDESTDIKPCACSNCSTSMYSICTAVRALVRSTPLK